MLYLGEAIEIIKLHMKENNVKKEYASINFPSKSRPTGILIDMTDEEKLKYCLSRTKNLFIRSLIPVPEKIDGHTEWTYILLE